MQDGFDSGARASGPKTSGTALLSRGATRASLGRRPHGRGLDRQARERREGTGAGFEGARDGRTGQFKDRCDERIEEDERGQDMRERKEGREQGVKRRVSAMIPS